MQGHPWSLDPCLVLDFRNNVNLEQVFKIFWKSREDKKN